MDLLSGTDGSGSTRHRRASGQRVGSAELGDEPGQSLTQVRDRSIRSITLAVGSNAGAELSVRAPDTVFVLLDGAGDMQWPAHRS